MSKREKNISLNFEEKKEIKDDVKEAFDKALESEKLTSIDKTINSAPEATLNQKEVDNIINKPSLKTKKASKKALIITLILLVLIAAGGLYTYFMNNPKTIFETAINKAFGTLSDNINSKPNPIQGNIQINTNFDHENYSELNKIKLNLDYESDNNNQISKINFNMTYDDNNLLSGLFYSENGENYLYSADLLNKYIKLDSTENTVTQTDVNILLDSLNKALIKSIDGEKITGSKMQIDINDKATKTYRSVLTIDKNNINKLADNFNSALQNDQDFLNTVAKISDKSQNEIQNTLNENTNEIKSSFNDNTITISIYTRGFNQKFTKLEINETINNVTNTYSLTKIDEETYNYLIKNSEEQMEGTITYVSKNNSESINTQNTLTTNGETLNFDFNIQNDFEKLSQVNKETITENTPISELTEEDVNYILSKLMNNEALLNLITNLS